MPSAAPRPASRAAKRARLIAAAQAYLATLASEPPCRFDAILIDGADADAASNGGATCSAIE